VGTALEASSHRALSKWGVSSSNRAPWLGSRSHAVHWSDQRDWVTSCAIGAPALSSLSQNRMVVSQHKMS
jgi:hypothetical protein